MSCDYKMKMTRWHRGLTRVQRRARTVIVVVALMYSSLALTQESIPWRKLTNEEQSLLIQVKEQWDDFTPERQERLRRGAVRWQQMRPEERREARQQQRLVERMPLDQRELIDQRFRQFNDVPRAQQQRLREIQREFRSLPTEQRDELRNRFESVRMQREQRRREGLDSPALPTQRPGVQELPRGIPRVIPPRAGLPEALPQVPTQGIQRPQPPRVNPPR